MDYLFLVCVAILIFCYLSVFGVKNRLRSVLIFRNWLLLMILTELSFFISSIGNFGRYFNFYELACSANILHAAFLYFYVLSFIKPNQKFVKKDFLHLVPLLVLVIYRVTVKELGYVNCLDDNGCDHSDNPYSIASTIYKQALMVFYVIWTKLVLLANKKSLKQKKINYYPWLVIVVNGAILLCTIVSMVQVLNLLGVQFAISKASVINVIISLFVISFVYVWNKYSFFLMKDLNHSPSDSIKYQDGLDVDKLQELYKQVEIELSDELILNQKNLNITKLSKLIGISEKQLSEVINRSTDGSYSDYINKKRVELFLRKLESGIHKSETLLSVAYSCGFNSKSTFNRAFKQITGKTPSQYLKSVENF